MPLLVLHDFIRDHTSEAYALQRSLRTILMRVLFPFLMDSNQHHPALVISPDGLQVTCKENGAGGGGYAAISTKSFRTGIHRFCFKINHLCPNTQTFFGIVQKGVLQFNTNEYGHVVGRYSYPNAGDMFTGGNRHVANLPLWKDGDIVTCILNLYDKTLQVGQAMIENLPDKEWHGIVMFYTPGDQCTLVENNVQSMETEVVKFKTKYTPINRK
jgi:hypothetical protein